MLDSLEMFDNGFTDVAAMANDSSCSGLSVDTLEQLQRRHVVQRDDQREAPMYKSKIADSGNHGNAYGMREKFKVDRKCDSKEMYFFLCVYHYANSRSGDP